MQRRVRQHEPEVGRARRDGRRRPAASGRRRASTIGRSREAQQRLRALADLDQRAGRLDVRDEQRERPVLAVLARAQQRDGGLVVGAAGEVVAAEALDREDLAVEEVLHGGAHGVVAVDRRPVALEQAHLRPAHGARVGLRVEAAVERVLVLGLARVAHDEARHRRQRPVVGDPADDREARPAVRAVQKRIAVAAVGRVGELGEAVLARRRVRRDGRRRGAAVRARDDLKARLADDVDVLRLDAAHVGQRRRVAREPRDERLDDVRRALRLDEHAALVVEHPAGDRRARAPARYTNGR